MKQNYRIEWKVDVEDFSEDGYESLKQGVEEEFGDDIESVETRKPLAVSGVVGALVVIAKLASGVAAVVKIIEYISEEEDTKRILVVVSEDVDEDDIEVIKGASEEVEILQRK